LLLPSAVVCEVLQLYVKEYIVRDIQTGTETRRWVNTYGINWY